MSKDEAKSLSQLIQASGSPLGRLARQAQHRTDLTGHLRSGLDDALAAAVLHADIRSDGTLVVAAATPEWAARLRFEEHQLRELCRGFGAKVTGIKIRTN